MTPSINIYVYGTAEKDWHRGNISTSEPRGWELTSLKWRLGSYSTRPTQFIRHDLTAMNYTSLQDMLLCISTYLANQTEYFCPRYTVPYHRPMEFVHVMRKCTYVQRSIAIGFSIFNGIVSHCFSKPVLYSTWKVCEIQIILASDLEQLCVTMES